MKVHRPAVGMICASAQGRDKDCIYVICGIQSPSFVYVADGAGKKLNCPKRKNVKHLVLTAHNAAQYGADFSNGSVNDCILAYAIKQYKTLKNQVGGSKIV